MIREFLSIGQIINTHGIKGELKVYPLTDDLKRFRKLKTIFIDDVERKVIWSKIQTDKVILKIEGIDSIEEADRYKNKYIEVKREDAVQLPEGRYYVADLIDCEVSDEEGKVFGKVVEVIKTGSNDVYWVKGSEEILVPALKTVVTSIDIEKGKIVIKPTRVWRDED